MCVWSAIELNVGLMCNCLVVLKPLVQRYGGKYLRFMSFTGSTGDSNIHYPSHSRSAPQNWKSNRSYPLSSVDRVVLDEDERRLKERERDDEGITVTNTYTVEDRERKDRGDGESENESQEDIVRRFRPDLV